MSQKGLSHPQEPKPFQVEDYKRLEVERANAAASTSLDWYRVTHGLRSEIEVHTILKHLRLGADMRVLDVGCGVGRISIAMAPYVRSVTAVDISPRSVEALTRYAAEHDLTNITATVSDMNELKVQGVKYDRAVAVQSLQHVPSEALRLDAVRRIVDALQPGALFVTVNYRWGGMISEDKEGMHADGRYRFAYSPEEIELLLRGAGLQRISVGGCLNLPYRMDRIARLMPRVFVRVDTFLSHLRVSRRIGKYLIATGTA